MQFSESWLRSFVNPPLSSAELSHRLTMSGLEVEEVTSAAPPFSGIVVAQVLEVAKHPDADRLNVCKVDAGTGTILNIVCGAPNVTPGIKVPCALVGAKLPPSEDGKPFEIKLGKLRGVESQGMLCSARELGISEEQGGLLILNEDAPLGTNVREVLDLDDQLFTLKLTPNRADCLSILGVAREVAALTSVELKQVEFTPVTVNTDEKLTVKVLAPDLCGRFTGRIIRGLNARAESPEWMKQRLVRSGQRSISALVDISNYVMLELGQPSHVFDLAKIEGEIEVRWGRKGETLKLLNGKIVEVDENVGVIAGEKEIESLAGVMGGDSTAVTLDTTDVYLEAAFWWPLAIQGRAKRYKFSTDAAHRFERGIDYAVSAERIERITRLIVDICGTQQTKVGPVDDHIVNIPKAKSAVRMRVARAVQVIGIPISTEEVADIFTRLNFQFTQESDTFLVVAPSYRFDIEIEEDLIEEVARCHGFENIPASLPVARYSIRHQPETQRSLHAIRDRLAACDYQETLNYSFVEEEWERDFAANASPVKLLNPIASQLAVMRSSLIGSLVANVRYNLNHKATRIRMFEIAKIYQKNPAVVEGELSVQGLEQPLRIAAIAYGHAEEDQWGAAARLVDYYDVKSDVENLFGDLDIRFVKPEASHPALHPGRSAQVHLDGKAIGWIGELHPQWLQKYELPQAPVLFEVDATAVQQCQLPRVQEIPKFPAVTRDLAFVVEQNIEVQRFFDVIASVRQQTDASATVGNAIQNVILFDEYRGKGLKDNEKSLAFRFLLQDTKQTLNDQAIEAALAPVIETLRVRLGATLRV